MRRQVREWEWRKLKQPEVCVCTCGGGGRYFSVLYGFNPAEVCIIFSPTSELQNEANVGNCSSQYVSSTEGDLEDEDPVWLASLDLSQSSRESLISGAWLNDKHMIAAMMLVKRNFPKIGGLQNPLCNKSKRKGFSPQPEGSIQIHHSFNHWVTSCYLDGNVKLYDFLFDRKAGLCEELQQQLKTIYRNTASNRQITVTVPMVQRQKGGQDCGVYAIACLFHLALGDKPEELHFTQEEMRLHLVQCFESETVLPFPHSRRRVRTSHVSVTITI